jgi:hypothetical protein
MVDELMNIEDTKEFNKEEYEKKARDSLLSEKRLYTDAIAFDEESFERSKQQIKQMEDFRVLLQEKKVIPTQPSYEFEKDERFVEINTFLYDTKIWQQLNDVKRQNKMLGEQIEAKKKALDIIEAKIKEMELGE